ncbi:hypothetical protein PKHYL_15070 [Psychrobacter sp. KH172YL61]|uniref:hypothetical protein n=1 Tax=Psychrobacter sp. KH172YL61 TaxID=2517899 RepID=UPI0010B70D0C|nr:hypothetical protein [Psychrobacter sp. KH172YL61]BBI67316.1 hypothetical protein PKHYL_15070 [Psychrobacter sp. KH172YL61]
MIQDSICEHYQQYEGSLPYDGVIKGYRLTIEQNNHVVDHADYGLPKIQQYLKCCEYMKSIII